MDVLVILLLIKGEEMNERRHLFLYAIQSWTLFSSQL